MTKEVQGRSLLDDLRRPEAYPSPRPSTVTQVTTHISWVFLTDREVWKLKRPVDYGFVDYTTLERRRRCCEDEVRLNRRLAPDVYLAVVPLRLGLQGYGFGADGDVVDYAVRMRRLPHERSADALLRHAALMPEHLTRLAARLARFFGDAAPTPEWGTIEVIRDHVTENFAQVEPFVGRLVSRETFDTVRSWQLGTLEQDPGRFQARVTQGRIRDGHGDLRLEHVYFEDADPIVIDCVEFSERLRSGDAAADVAFLGMELTARGRVDLAERFLADFALESDDYDLYGVVDFDAGYRAWVRGKVAAFLSADPSTPPEKAARKGEEARTLFALAHSYSEARTVARPVVAIGGVIGSGKSTLAEAVGRATGVPVLSSDRTRKALAGVPPTSKRRTTCTRRHSRRGRSTSCSAGPPWCWAPGAASCWTRRSASATSDSVPATWPDATGGGSSSPRRCATRPRSANACVAAPGCPQSPMPGKRSSSASARSSSQSRSSAPVSTFASTRPGGRRRHSGRS
jgi:uncharacterized protein